VLFIGSYPPRACGIATFTKDVVDYYDAHAGVCSDVVAIDDRPDSPYAYGTRVVASLLQDDRSSYYHAARLIDRHPCEIVNVQHEYGLFGGEHGVWCVDLIETISKPAVLTMHTVLPDPKPDWRRTTQLLCRCATRVIVLSQTARQLLIDAYAIDPWKIDVVHHGAPDVPYQPTLPAKNLLGIGDRPTVSTFGLLSRGKGLEHAIAAMHLVARRHPEILYLILGATHPVVKRQEGEGYRASLLARIETLRLSRNVRMIDSYLTLDQLVTYLSASDIYLTPYRNPAQVVSGTLAYAFALGKAIVSTPYLYAQELLAAGRGLLAKFEDPLSIAHAIETYLDFPELRRATERRAYSFGRRMAWPRVATRYDAIFQRVAFASRSSALAAVTPA
jgi:polysaccharide biosynthesis protein PslF